MAYYDTGTRGNLKADKTVILSANNASANVNLFSFNAPFLLKRIYAVCTSKTTLTNMTGCYFDMYDGASVALTKNDGVLSTLAVGGIFYKNGSATTTTFSFNSASSANTNGISMYTEECFIVAKTATTCYIRFNYTTTDAPINATIKFFIEYEDILGQATLLAV